MKPKTLRKKKPTIQQRRVEIAKDALAQLRLEKYISTPGSYVVFPDSEHNFRDKITKDEEADGVLGAKECLLQFDPKCKVCAKGAIFLSTIRKENKLKLADLGYTSTMESNSAEIFGQENLDLMEAVFENWPFQDRYNSTYAGESDEDDDEYDYIGEITKFYVKYPNDNDRLQAILKNVIKNKGTFTL